MDLSAHAQQFRGSTPPPTRSSACDASHASTPARRQQVTATSQHAGRSLVLHCHSRTTARPKQPTATSFGLLRPFIGPFPPLSSPAFAPFRWDPTTPCAASATLPAPFYHAPAVLDWEGRSVFAHPLAVVASTPQRT